MFFTPTLPFNDGTVFRYLGFSREEKHINRHEAYSSGCGAGRGGGIMDKIKIKYTHRLTEPRMLDVEKYIVHDKSATT